MIRLWWAAALAAILSGGVAAAADLSFLNHGHPVLDAHNCYPYDGHWNDRVQYEALSRHLEQRDQTLRPDRMLEAR